MNRKRSYMALLALAGLMMIMMPAGCDVGENDHAASAARQALGVADDEAETRPKKVLYEVVERVIDPETDKVLSEKKSVTPVTIQVEIEKDVKTDVGETHAEAG